MAKDWWKAVVFYEIYVPSFKDSDGDGVGDLKGISQKLDYLVDLGVEGLWLTPFYLSPKVDNGYDIADYFTIDPVYGTMEDFESLIEQAHKRGIKVIADLVVNHTSTEHAWFQEARKSKVNAKRDWYIWRKKPNNWTSFFGGSAWEWEEATKEFYYHSFAKEQADLNWQNPEVEQAIFEVIDYWLEKGLDGFRLDVINNLTVAHEFQDNPFDQQGSQVHLHDVNQKGIYAVLEKIVARIKAKNPAAFTVGEISSDKLARIHSYAKENLFDVTFNFNLGSIKTWEAKAVFTQLEAMENQFSEGNYPTLFFGSHDMARLYTRLAENDLAMAKMIALLMLSARGIPFIYFGEEIGMQNFVPQNIQEMKDVQSIQEYDRLRRAGLDSKEALRQANQVNRDQSRNPMNWSKESFTEGVPWLGAGAEQPQPIAELYEWYQQIITFRKKGALAQYPYKKLSYTKDVIWFQRGSYLLVFNFSKQAFELNEKVIAVVMASSLRVSNTLVPAKTAIIYKVEE